MIRYTWKLTFYQIRTPVESAVVWLPPFKPRPQVATKVEVVRRFPRSYKTPQAAEQARQAWCTKSRLYPPEAKWELEEIQTCPNQFDPLLLTPLRSRMERLRQAHSSQS